MAADRDSCYHDRVAADPAIIFYTNQGGRTFLVADWRMDIGIAVVHGQDADVLREDHVVTYFGGADDDVADADNGAAADGNVTHSVIDGGEVFDDGAVAALEFPEGHDV